MKVSQKLMVTGLAVAFLLLGTSLAFADDQGPEKQPTVTQTGKVIPQTVILSGTGIGSCLGMALSLIGAGFGLGKIGSAALEAMARQPEAANKVQTAMIIVAAMLEGATLASVVLCFLIGFLQSSF
jgi:F-type H+-transporting ATPase subunit c